MSVITTITTEVSVVSQELDYGALYEVRTPHFYVEANKMPTARVSETVCTVDLWFYQLKIINYHSRFIYCKISAVK